ncbi:MAG TPA: DUF2167 domain-containing protein [Chthoniobacteraceae bacterium]|nr:DUF2167 domain-containing protein [Chthoniobacteraceae bacterium]
MIPRFFSLLLCCGLALAVPDAFAEKEEAENQYNLKVGPMVGDLGMAQLQVPEGYIFAAGSDTRRIMEAMGNPPTDLECGFFAPEDMAWFVVYEFYDTGYIKDAEKEELDADALLASIREGTEAGNEERTRRGWHPLEIVGWEKTPFYNPTTQNLEWATRTRDKVNGEVGINYNVRVLGRRGTMAVTLVVDPEHLAGALPTFQKSLAGYEFKSGHRYAEWRQGDKIAQYGLTGLILGGGAAMASKFGLLQKLWKIILIPVFAVFGYLSKLFKKKEE